MKPKTTIGLLTCILIAGCLYAGAGCNMPETAKGTLTLNLTDAPGEYESVYITFTEVSVHRGESQDNSTQVTLFRDSDNESEADNETDTDTDNQTAADDDGWIVISSEEQGFDLLTLRNGAFDLLAQAKLDAGVYTQVRLKITDATDDSGEPKTYVQVDGEKYPLVVPSGTKSGLKLTRHFTITGDNETVLYLDFDAEKSVRQTGSGTYHLKPTIKILTEPPQGQ